MFTLTRTVVKEVKETLTFTNYAEFILTQELRKQNDLLAAGTVVAENMSVGTSEYISVEQRIEQLHAAIKVTKYDNDLPF